MRKTKIIKTSLKKNAKTQNFFEFYMVFVYLLVSAIGIRATLKLCEIIKCAGIKI